MDEKRLPDLRARMRRRRLQLGLTGTGLAQRAGISTSYVSLIETGAKVPEEDVAAGLARALDDDEALYRAWARAVVDRAFDGPYERKYAVGCAYLRGAGRGRIVRVENADAVNKKIGKYVEEAKLPTPGAPKSDSYEGDGFAVVRDRDTKTVEDVLKYVIENLRVVYA